MSAVDQDQQVLEDELKGNSAMARALAAKSVPPVEGVSLPTQPVNLHGIRILLG